MSNKGDVSNYTGVFRLASPSSSGPDNRKVIKRNRQVISCLPCRSRKLKCDRQQPCASCVRRHDEASCKFFGGPGSPSGGSVGDGGGQPAPAQMEVRARLRMLEDLVSGMMMGGAIHTAAGDADSPGGGERPRGAASPSGSDGPGRGGHLSREGAEVRSVGATSHRAVLDCIRGLRGIVDAMSSSAPARAASPPRRRAPDRPCEPGGPITIQEVMKHLPPRSECDNILTSYFQQIYMIPPAVHTGQFQREYEKFWEAPGRSSLLWISILFTLLSASTFQQASKATGASLAPEAQGKIADLSSMAHRCLLSGDPLSNKPYCVEASLLFGMHLVLQKRDAGPLCWHSVSTAIRLAQQMGYHRDASNLSRSAGSAGVSPFEAEMRRRTWYTLEWLDVACSWQLGVPPVIQGSDVDTQLPSNLRDDEFNEDSRVLPQTRPTLDLTPILGFIYYSRQLKILRRITQQALAVVQPSYGDVRRLNAELHALREDIPPSLRYRPIRESGFADVPDVIVWRILCEMVYLKSLCILHRRYLTFARDSAVYCASRETCREASLWLLDLQAELDEHSGEGGRLSEKRYLLTNTGYHDFLLAAMCICLDLIVGSRNNQQESEHKTKALGRARTIWSKMADACEEAAHATGVLDHILARIPQPEPSASSEMRPETTKDGERSASSAPSTTAASTLPSKGLGLTSRMGRRGVSPLGPSWSAVNRHNDDLPAAAKAELKSYSQEWSYAWLDNLGKREVGPLDDVLTSGVDWNRIDSFLLNREHTMGSSRPPRSAGEGSEASREGWPYLQYRESNKSAADPVNFRTWARSGVTIAGFGPASSGADFI